MTIRINQIAVDFTLEKEKTFADLTLSLRAWANGQNLAILGILADGKGLGPEDPTGLGQISEVEVEAVPAGERDLARVAVIARFFALLSQGWESTDATLIDELHQEFASVRVALFPLLSAVAPRLTQALDVLDGPWTDPVALKNAARRLTIEAEGIRKELQHPLVALTESLDSLDQSLVGLERLAGLFQKGNDKDGFTLILQLFTVYEDVGRRAALVGRISGSDQEEWTRFNTELQPLLKEAEAALEAGDYILLTDLLEYELTPRLSSVRAFFLGASNLDRVPGLH